MKTGGASIQVHHLGPVLSKWIPLLIQAETGPALAGGSSWDAHGYLTHQTTLHHGTVSTWWPLTKASSARKLCGWLFQAGRDSQIKILVKRKKAQKMQNKEAKKL